MSQSTEEYEPRLDERIAELEAVLAVVRLSISVLIEATADLINLLIQRADRDGDDSVDLALAVTNRTLEMIPFGRPERRDARVAQALVLEARYDQHGAVADLDAAIANWRQLVQPDPEVASAAMAEATARLGALLRTRLDELVASDADDQAIEAALIEAQHVLQMARDTLPADSDSLGVTAWMLGLCWIDLYDRVREADQLHRGIVEIEAALRVSDVPLLPRPYAVLSRALHERAAIAWQAAGRTATDAVRVDLRAAVDQVRVAIRIAEPTDPLRIDAMMAGAMAASAQLSICPDDVDLAELRSWTTELKEQYGGLDPGTATDEAATINGMHVKVLAAIIERDPHAATPEVQETLSEAAQLIVSNLSQAGANFLGTDLSQRPRADTLARPDLAAAGVEESVHAWRAMPSGPHRAAFGGLVACMSLNLYQCGLAGPDYPAMIELTTEALTIRHDDATYQLQLSLVLSSLLTMHSYLADTADVNRAIEILSGLQPEDPRSRREVLAGLATALQVRATRTREVVDLKAARLATERLLDDMPAADELHASAQILLYTLDLQLGEAENDAEAVERGVNQLRDRLRDLPERDTRRAMALANLAVGEIWLLERQTTPERAARVRALIEEADRGSHSTTLQWQEIRWRLTLLGTLLAPHEAGPMTATQVSERLRHELGDREHQDAEAMRLKMMLGVSLTSQAMEVRSHSDADAAVGELEAVQAQLGDSVLHPLWSEAALALGRAYRTRAELAEPVNRVEDRARSRRQGQLALRGRAWRVLVQSNTDHAMAVARDAADVAVEIAGWCVQDRAAAEAAAALDAGRGLILHAASVTPDLGQTEYEPAIVAADPRSRRLRRMVDEAPEAIDSSPLLDPPLMADIQRALHSSGAQALVYLVGQSADITPVAVFVPAVGVPDIVDLPIAGMAPGDYVAALARAHIQVRQDAGSGRDIDADSAVAGGPQLRNTLPDLTHWAWQAAMGRVFDRCLEYGFSRPYRLVLVPMGELGVVPWHAARSPAGRYAVQDAVVSYAASARLLCDVLARTPIAVERGSLIVGNPTRDLVSAGVEAVALRERFYSDGLYLSDSSTPTVATPAAVLEWLAATVGEARGVLHLACHGEVQMRAANSSRILLADGAALSAEHLVESRHWVAGACQVGLVCLAACSTGIPGRGYDEAFSLATAFQVAGARSVVSSLWRVPDEATSLLMYMLHHYIVADSLGPAEALRLAQLWMLDPGRRKPSGMPAQLAPRLAQIDHEDIAAWAGFIHLGQW